MAKDKGQSVIGVIFNQEKTKVLLIKRRDIPVWVLPGGGVDAGEEPDEAVIREVHEETGYEVKINKKLGEYTPLHWLTNYTHLYECTPIGGLPSIGEETAQIRFFPLNKLPKNMPEPFPSWIQDAVHFKKFIQRPIAELNNKVVIKFLLKNPFLISRFLLTRLGFVKPKK
ncbi:MAG: hypothetical protein Tsb0015_09390 [Simkaniaceae bacterium]